MSHEQAVSILIEENWGKRKAFDADIVDAFLKLKEDFKKITAKFADSDEI